MHVPDGVEHRRKEHDQETDNAQPHVDEPALILVGSGALMPKTKDSPRKMLERNWIMVATEAGWLVTDKLRVDHISPGIIRARSATVTFGFL